MAEGTSERQRKMTVKGVEYNFDIKCKERKRLLNSLDSRSQELNMFVADGSDFAGAKNLYRDWLIHYEKLLFVHDECQAFLNSEEKTLDDERFQEKNEQYLQMKSAVEAWFLRDGANSVKGRSSITSRASSQISAARLKEEQKQAELKTRALSLAKKQELEERKLKLKMQEEEFEIKTELEISEAKSRVIETLEKSMTEDDAIFLSVNTKQAVGEASGQRERTIVEDIPASTLNPNAPPYVRFSSQDDNSPIGAFEKHRSILSDLPQVPALPNKERDQEGCNDIRKGVDIDLTAVSRELNKPKADIQDFDGNPMQYNRFIRQFNSRVCANTESYEERLNFLLQFTKGEAHKIVSGYSHLDAECGFNAALSEFKERYGDADVIAHSYVKRALGWPNIKHDSAKSLDEYAIFLSECQYAVENVKAARVLEYAENMKLLVQKLPFYLHEKWRNIVYELKEKQEVVKFQNLVMFVRKEAKKAVDPIYGKEVMGTGRIDKNSDKKKKPKGNDLPRKTFAINVSDNMQNEQSSSVIKTCLYCNGQHSLQDCRAIRNNLLRERYAFLKSKGLCFACLKTGHVKGSCLNKSQCYICKRTHPSILHVDPLESQRSSMVTQGKAGVTNNATSTATHTGAGSDLKQVLPIVPVRLKATKSDKFIETYAFLDSGSTATFCCESIIDLLNLEGKQTKISITTMGQTKIQKTSIVSGLEIASLDGECVIELPPVYTRVSLPVSSKDVISYENVQKWQHLKNIPLERINSEVGILIGINVPKAMEPWEVIPSSDGGPFAVKTAMGWVVNGPLGEGTNNQITTNFIAVAPSLEDEVRDYFNRDFSERTVDDKLEHSKEDQQFMKIASESVKLKNGHYEIDLPFKTSAIFMPNNRKQAEQRLTMLGKRFRQDEALHNDYNEFMNKVIEKGYAQPVDPENKPDEGKVWYLPHHGVRHPKKGKLRVVFDCAAKFQGTSLNDQLLQGPNLTSSLIGTLIKFRQEKIAVMGDIESMFYQVHVPTKDQNFQRFLWWQGGDPNKPVVEYQMKVHLFGSTSSPSCANFALRKTAMDQQGQFNEDIIDTVLKNFYVDDCLKSVPTVERGKSLVNDLQHVLKGGGFHISKWISNNREVMASIPVAERAKEIKDLDLDHDILPVERALGMNWCVESDVFCYNVVIRDHPCTRRGILSTVSSIYDPLGFLSPLVLNAKTILQELCKLQIGWDDPVPEKYSDQWYTWLGNIHKLSTFKIDRCYKPEGFEEIQNAQLHHFADASEKGYGTVTYLRVENAAGKIHCAFVIGKSRVMPLKQVTIPRMELTAATVAVRTDRMVKEELQIPIDQTCFWTDSMSVLRYIQNTTCRFQTFVANRLVVIHDGSNPEQWHHIRSKMNPADFASRGIPFDKSIWQDRWIKAPTFLWEAETQWPESIVVSNESLVNDPEVKKESVKSFLTSVPSQSVGSDSINKLIHHYSVWYKLKKGVAWILKVRRELLRRVQQKQGITIDNKGLETLSSVTVKDMSEAERAILVYVQKQEFADEINVLQKQSSQMHRRSTIRKLDPIYEDGLLRVGGRLHHACMPEESKHSIILPKCHHVSNLVVQDIHINLKHSGRNHVLSKLRERFWVISAPSVIRKQLSKCVICRRINARVGEQKMADLPRDRVTADEPPFTHVGVDYFGPFEVKQRRSYVKRYGVIFTCLTSRAIHLEVAHTLDTNSYINALRRFIARRGQVSTIRSDNGTNFVGAERELKEALNEWNISQIHEAMLQGNIDWKFSPPAGSHHGGVWERLIRSVRKAMNSVLKEQTLNDENLHTLMCEIEAVLNGRPITRVSDHHNDLEALTPNHLLLMKIKPSFPPGLFSKRDNYCRRRWRQVQFLANLFWQRWVHEYLPILQERQKWHEKKRNLKTGDIVLIVDAHAPRNSWLMGVILETLPDRLGFVRQVRLKTATSTLTRPIDKLCLILEAE